MLSFKKISIFILVLLTVFASFVIPAKASVEADNQLSEWAEPEVSAAIEKGLVPAQLQSKYQNNITRYQYVLLALKVFDITEKNVDISEIQPFTDVLNHEYEQEIVRAYNAGIVKGDGKGNFIPDNFITREEIASLVYNLLKQIAPDKDFTVQNEYAYSDDSEISDWARAYIDFCFENSILAGYGNNVIDPKGNATIEQSIALLYRLAKNEGLLNSEQGPIKLEEIDSEIKNNFVAEYSAETFDILRELSDSEKAEISSFWDKSATVFFEHNTISLNSPEFEKNLFALIHDINEELFVLTYKELMMDNFNEGEQGVLLFDEHIEKMTDKELIEVYEEIGENEVFVIESMQDIDGNVSYLMGFIQRNQ